MMTFKPHKISFAVFTLVHLFTTLKQLCQKICIQRINAIFQKAHPPELQ